MKGGIAFLLILTFCQLFLIVGVEGVGEAIVRLFEEAVQVPPIRFVCGFRASQGRFTQA